MVPQSWILCAFCLVPYVKGTPVDSVACDRAAAEHKDVQEELSWKLHNAVSVLTPVWLSNSTSNTSVQAATICPGVQINLTAQAVENVVSHCSHTSQECAKRTYLQIREMDFGADVLRAAGKFCQNVQAAEYMQHLQTLAPCWKPLSHRWQAILRADSNFNEQTTYQLVTKEEGAAKENFTVSCGFRCGRKCACRNAQILVPMYTTLPSAHIRDVCGQTEHNLVLELQKRVLDALNCSEFGDYVRDFGLFQVNFQANETSPDVRH